LPVFIQEAVIKRDGHSDMGTALMRILSTKLEERETKTRLMFEIPSQIDIPEGGISPVEYFLVQADSAVIAQQLTMIEFGIYQRVEVTELLNQAWNKPKLKHRSPNVLALISRSTKLSLWLATMVLLADKVPQRVRIIEKFIDICTHLVTMHNFNTLMSFIAGLNLSCVHRLKKTTKKLSAEKKKLLEKYHTLMSPDSSYKIYRAELKVTSPPLLPYLGVSLTDLTFTEEGNPDFVDGGKINVRKREMTFLRIRELVQPQTSPYSFPIVEPLYTFLTEVPYIASDQELYELSQYIEPREDKNKKKS